MAIENGPVSPLPVNPAAGEIAAPVTPLISEMLLAVFTIQTLPIPSIARLNGPLMPPPVKLSATVKSLGCEPSAGANGGFAVESPYRFATFAPGLCAMLRSEERRVGEEGRSRWAPYN